MIRSHTIALETIAEDRIYFASYWLRVFDLGAR